MFGSRGLRRSEVARARLRALTPGWVPTPELVAEAFAEPTALAGPDTSVRVEAPLSQGIGAPRDTPPSLTDLPELTPRIRIDRSAARGLVALAVGAVAGAGLVLFLGWPRGEQAPPIADRPIIGAQSGAPGSPLASDEQPSVTPTGVVVVDVAGLVRKPGVHELPAGSRVIDAIQAAGGVAGRGDTTGLNLAQVLVDGEQVLVPTTAGQPLVTPGVAPPSAGATSSALVDINTATLEQLDTLPGIGPVLAQAIIDWRTQNGSFASIEQLQEVSGIGEATYADLQPLVRV